MAASFQYKRTEDGPSSTSAGILGRQEPQSEQPCDSTEGDRLLRLTRMKAAIEAGEYRISSSLLTDCLMRRMLRPVRE